MRFIGPALAQEESMAPVREESGVSRKTGYKWLGRYVGYRQVGVAVFSSAGLSEYPRLIARARQSFPHDPQQNASFAFLSAAIATDSITLMQLHLQRALPALLAGFSGDRSTS